MGLVSFITQIQNLNKAILIRAQGLNMAEPPTWVVDRIRASVAQLFSVTASSPTIQARQGIQR